MDDLNQKLIEKDTELKLKNEELKLTENKIKKQVEDQEQSFKSKGNETKGQRQRN